MSASFASWKVKWGLFSLLLLTLFVLAHLGAVFVGLRFLLPSVWKAQLQAGWLSLVLVFIGVCVLNCFLEWFVHRNILHIVVVSWFRDIYRRHGRHHGFTLITLLPVSGQMREIFSRYTIVEDKQFESVSFADYTLSAFFGFHTIPLALLQFIFPGVPFLLGGYSAIACSYWDYEIVHPLEHMSEEWWQTKRYNPVYLLLRPFANFLRRFHEYHHFKINCNMAIAGFFGFPLADLVFGTYKLPVDFFRHGALINEEQLKPPVPSAFVIKLDAWAKKRSRELLMERLGLN